MGHLIRRNGDTFTLETGDAWQQVSGDAEIPADGDILVGVARWDPAKGRSGRTGVFVAPEDDVRTLAGQLDGVEQIHIAFPVFGDGRGYSHARILRDELGYRGRLRAVGEILHDQLWHLARCGFDEFDLHEDKDPHYAIERAFATWSEVYVPASDGREPVINRVV